MFGTAFHLDCSFAVFPELSLGRVASFRLAIQTGEVATSPLFSDPLAANSEVRSYEASQTTEQAPDRR